MTDREVDWYDNRHQTMAYNLPSKRPDKENTLVKEMRKRHTASNNQSQYRKLKEKLTGSAEIRIEYLEKVLALMKQYDAETVEIFFKDNYPLFMEQKDYVGNTKTKAIIAPRIDKEEAEEMEEFSDEDIEEDWKLERRLRNQ